MNLLSVNYENRFQFWHWCHDQGFHPEYQKSIRGIEYFDIWYIPDDKLFTLAALRWA
jgi:hypothetical protein